MIMDGSEHDIWALHPLRLLTNQLKWIRNNCLSVILKIGLAVGDIEAVQRNAKLKRIAMQVRHKNTLRMSQQKEHYRSGGALYMIVSNAYTVMHVPNPVFDLIYNYQIT